MKKKLSDLLKNLILPSITVGVVSFFLVFLFVDNRRQMFHDPKFIHLDLIISISMALVFGPFIWFSIFMHRRLQRSYTQMDVWRKEIQNTEDVLELESYIESLKNFKYSAECPSPQHMRYANETILIARTKINTINKIDSKKI